MNVPRYPVAGSRGVVATPHYLASEAGLRVLQDGGNAIDAAIAANAVLGVVEPGMCGIGGDLFMLIHSAASGKLMALNASGRSPYGVNLDWFRQRGIDRMPLTGPFTVSVPGVVDGWVTANQKLGTRPLSQLLAPAIQYADEGFPVRRHLQEGIEHSKQLLASHPVSAGVFLPDGEVPAMGRMVRNPALAASLREVAAGGRQAVYEGGPLGKAILATVERHGWPLAQRDLADQRSEWVEPIATEYRGRTIYELPPPNQGMAVLMALKVLEGFDLRRLGAGNPEATHLQIEAKKAAFQVRNRHCADPAFYQAPMNEFLSEGYAAKLRSGIKPGHAVVAAAAGATGASKNDGDTIYLCTADGQGNCVSLIQSNYAAWGSGVMAGDAGFFLHSRGAGFVLDPEHPNHYEPHRRPFHTLIPAMAYKDGRPWLIFGTRGADAQPQTQVQLVCNIVDFDMNVQEALDAPRWRTVGTYHHPTPDHLLLESRFAHDALPRLKALGHEAHWSTPADDGMGHAAVIEAGADGVLLAGYDPRSDGAALGW